MGRLLGIDYGQKRIGLAISDPNKIISKPLKTLLYSDQKQIIKDLFEVISMHEIEKIIIGNPVAMTGENTDQTKSVMDFVDLIKREIKIPYEMVDERLSSVSAKRALIAMGIKTGHNKSMVDETAAAIFLQHYLDKINY